MLLRNTLAEEGRPTDDYQVPTGVVPRVIVDPKVPPGEMHVCQGYRRVGTNVDGPQARLTPEQMAATQPAPKPNGHPAAWPLVMKDMIERDQLGRQRYGTPLQPHNGRDTLLDAYQEALDLAVYLRTAIYERDGK